MSGVTSGVLCSDYALWCQAGVISGIVWSLLAWWSSQTSSLSRLHGASLVIILRSLLSRPARVAPCKGHLSQAHCHLGPTVPGGVLLVSSSLSTLGAHLVLPGVGPEVISGSVISGSVRPFRCSYVRTLSIDIVSSLPPTEALVTEQPRLPCLWGQESFLMIYLFVFYVNWCLPASMSV